MQNQQPNSMVFWFQPGTNPQVIVELAEAIDLYHDIVIDLFFALRGAHDNGGEAKVKELHDYIKEWVRRQIRIMEVGEP